MQLNDVLLAAETRLSDIQDSLEPLLSERDELLTFMRVYERLTKSQPSPAVTPAAPGASDSAYSPEGASDAGRFDSGSLTEIAVKEDVRVVPREEAPGNSGPVGVGRSDSGESTVSAGEASLASSPAPVSQSAEATTGTGPDSIGELDEEPVDADPAANEGGEDESLTQSAGEGRNAALPRRGPRDLVAQARADVQDTHTAHPEFTISQAADALCMARTVVAKISREVGLRWSTAPKEPEPAAEPDEPGEAAEGAGEEIVATDPPRPANVVPFEPTRFGGPAVVHTPIRRAPKGKKFRLTDGDGNYLRFDCQAMVAGTKNTWEGTEAQLAACRRRFDLARGLHEKPVEKAVR